MALATVAAPLLIAKDFTYYDKHLTAQKLSGRGHPFSNGKSSSRPHQKSKTQRTAVSNSALLAVLLDDKIRLNELLAKSGQTAQVALSTPLFTRFANTFLRKIWHYDYQNASGIRNVLSKDVDGGGYLGVDPSQSANWECGWVRSSPGAVRTLDVDPLP